MREQIREKLHAEGLMSLEFFVRRNETEEQRLMWRKWKSDERKKRKQEKIFLSKV